MAVQISAKKFDRLVDEALDLIPKRLARAVDNVVVLIADRNPDEPELLGLYEGVPLGERGSDYGGSLPDVIHIYRDAILEICESEDDVVDEIAITVIHEFAHYFGINDEQLHEWGWG